MVEPLKEIGLDERRTERVQSIQRAFVILEIIADSDHALGLSEIAQRAGHSQPTAHRSLRTLVDLGYVWQEPSRRYALGPGLIRLGERAVRGIRSWAHPILDHVVEELGESVNLAMLEGDRVVYIAHVPSPQSVRMFTEVGSRAYPHATGVGKALLAQMSADDVRDLVQRTGMPSFTPHTITDLDQLLRELVAVVDLGYAIDREEQEIGVRCVAVPVPDAAIRVALSVSGPSTRMGDSMLGKAVPALESAAAQLSKSIPDA